MRRLAHLAVLCLTACASASGPATRPEFPLPRDGVFQDPVAVVKSTDDDLLPSIVPAANIVAYASKAVDGNVDIYVRPLAGGAAIRLTTHSADDSDPELSPDGRRLVWTSQAEDVKGDIWVMQTDGGDKEPLTDRATADDAPTWSPDGTVIYFTSREPGATQPRIDAIEVESGERKIVVERGWDPAIAPDGRILFFVALDDRPQPRIYAKNLVDGRVAAITDGTYIEGLPKVASGVQPPLVLLTRWVDDKNGDGLADADDPPSLWSVELDEAIFAETPPRTPRPLTPGEGGEIFASVVSDWLVYTTAGYGDLEIYALPTDGVISTGVGPTVVLDAARAEENPALRRLALRYLVATSPELRASARYELARELAERERWVDAIDELQRVVQEAEGSELSIIASLEMERLRALRHLRGALLVREDAERRFVEERLRAAVRITAGATDSAAIRARASTVRAELNYALGRRQDAIEALQRIAQSETAPAEDGARAFDRLGAIYADLGSLDAVARASETTLRRFGSQRYYARRAAERWVAAAESAVGVPPLAALESIVTAHTDLPAVAARAAVALATRQQAERHEEIALQQWRDIASEFGSERAVLAKALLALGEAAERQGDQTEATAAYERLVAEFPGSPGLRGRASRGITRINLLTARQEENAGQLEKARESYGRVLRNNRELVLAHRRFIALSAHLGKLERVLAAYEKEAETRPRDKYARYGYGYALTFKRPVPLDDAEQEIVASLTLDPRFAAAHLTLGWIREQREAEEERAGWLEKADDSYEIARSLVDEQSEPDLWAAAHLNRGNVLLRLGKTDDAFESYLARELSGLPFTSPVTELLFREHFARVALREGNYDVALDMARLGETLSRQLTGRPRHGTMAALIAAISLQIDMHEEAARWYEYAAGLYTKRKDWVRVVPMLRGAMMAQRLLGRDDDALQTASDLLRILDRGDGPVEPVRGLVGNLLRGEIVREVPASSENVTRAIYGFDSEQEEEIVRAALMRIQVRRGNLGAAAQSDEHRMDLVREEAADSRKEDRVRRELLLAVHASAILALRTGDLDAGMSRCSEAIGLAKRLKAWDVLAVTLEAVAHLWIDSPAHRSSFAVELARAAAKAALAATSSEEPLLSARFARWLALDHLSEARQAPTVEGTAPGERFHALLGALDESLEAAKTAADFARTVTAAQEAPDLAAHLAAYSGETTPSGPDEATVAGAPLSWQWRFDRALWERGRDTRGPDPVWLMAAIEAFERQPAPRAAPELQVFLLSAVELLRGTGQIERAWLLLERARLLELQPPERRIEGGPLAPVLEAVRKKRDDTERYLGEVQSASLLVRAIEAVPASLDEVRSALGKEAVLVQAFAPLPDHWYWFVIDASGVELAATEPYRDADLAPILASAVSEEPGSEPAILYLDAGELIDTPALALQWTGEPLLRHFEVSEVLSATYLAAAAEKLGLTNQDVLSLGVDTRQPGVITVPFTVANRTVLERYGTGRLLIHLSLAAAAFAQRKGSTQVSFEVAPETHPKNRFDLDTIAHLRLDSTMALVERAPATPKAARAIAQAFLLAGVPTVAIGASSPAADALRSDLMARIATDRPSSIVADRARDKLPSMRLFGWRGLTAKQRVALAASSVIEQTKRITRAVGAAREKNDPELWRDAQEKLREYLETVTFLRLPASLELMPPSRLKQTLQPLELLAQDRLAETHSELGEIEEAAALQELIIQAREISGNAYDLAKDHLALGKTLYKGKRPEQAARSFQRCADLAASLDAELVRSVTRRKTREEGITLKLMLEADCRSRLASMFRDLYAYEEAVRAYKQAIQLYASLEAPNEVYPRRYLGFLYADVLNEYERAIEEFRAALRMALARGVSAMASKLVIDIARVLRQRGDYEQALAQVRSSEEMLREASAGDRAEAALEAAKIYWYRGNYRRALRRQKSALDLARAARDTFREIQAISLAGLIALNQGELDLAERQINAALDLSRITDRRREQATQLNNLGIVQRQAGRADEAIESFEKALAIDEELGSVEGRAYDLRHLGFALQKKGEHRAALRRLTEALELSRSIGNQYNELQCLFGIGEAQGALGRKGSQASYREAIELARKTSVSEVEWRSLYALGRIAERRGDTAEARALFGDALSVAERLGRGRSESSAQNSRDDLYADAIQLAIADDDIEAAYLVLERSRARDLLDVLATRDVPMPDPRAKQLLDAELETRELRIAAERAVALGLPEREERLRKAVAKHNGAMARLERAFPLLARAFTIDPVGLEALRSRLPPGVVVVSFFVGRRSTAALVISNEAAHPLRISIGRDGLTRRVGWIRQAMRAFGSVEDDLASLSRSLIEPLGDAIREAEVLVIVPHGPLNHVPFAALSLDGEPLLSRVVLAQSPSASMLADRLSKPPRATPRRILALATGDDLPFAALEARAIAGQAAIVGEEASETLVRGARADALDLAAHGELDARDPLASAIRLSPSQEHDGRLELFEIFALTDLPPLVTLSACDSVSGSLSGSEWLGLAGAFLTAGVQTVVATSNRVSDLAAAVVMKRFYRAASDRSAGEALQQAALAVRRYFPHPAHWSNFVLLGDFR